MLPATLVNGICSKGPEANGYDESDGETSNAETVKIQRSKLLQYDAQQRKIYREKSQS